jgi:hypothetical protein
MGAVARTPGRGVAGTWRSVLSKGRRNASLKGHVLLHQVWWEFESGSISPFHQRLLLWIIASTYSEHIFRRNTNFDVEAGLHDSIGMRAMVKLDQ